MAATQVSCILCGAPIENVSPQTIGWMSEFRALYCTFEEPDVAHLSMLGLKQHTGDIIPLDPQMRLGMPELSDEDTCVAIQLMDSALRELPHNSHVISHRVWGFPLHGRCWRVLTVAYSGSIDDRFIQALFELCRCCSIQLGTLDWGHDYGGLAGYNDEPGRFRPGNTRLTNHNYYRVDPFRQPELTKIFSNVHATEALVEQKYDQRKRNLAASNTNELSQQDYFRMLPTELLDQILVILCSSDVRNLRQASRSVSEATLSNEFWHSRFLPGGEFAHVFEAACELPGAKCWKHLFDRVRAIQGQPALVNRKRIWKLACGLCDLIDMRLASSVCYGSPNEYNTGFRMGIDSSSHGIVL
ncbi:hypothetical protein BKA67DRAFT_539061 [Truncatella angustata]|uniref:F-box domain-containing protein n=1 Tax=Truncatella angustata TaxID=152316 RepID=A0A9P8UFP8_9PEZI|nr:uncharacterized protein BKA67DRAFT_539061 [Truncatella angustata]KAH6649064.1 hypothetical protein BKA67DRAFT_539061 [Truncatella angustata]